MNWRNLFKRLGISIGVLMLAFVLTAAFLNWNAPSHCRLLFGSSSEIELQLEVDGDRILLRQASDQAPQVYSFSDGRFPKGVSIPLQGPGSNVQYTITGISGTPQPVMMTGFFGRLTRLIFSAVGGRKNRDSLIVNVKIEDGQSTYKQYCDVELRRASSDLAIGHFHGPLTIGPNTVYWEVPESTKLVRGDKPTDLRLEIGTMDKQRGCWTVVETCTRESNFPDNVYPSVLVEFPPKNPGDPPVIEKYMLDQFC